MKYCHVPAHKRRPATHEQKLGYCMFWTPVCRECRNETPWHLTKTVRKPKAR